MTASLHELVPWIAAIGFLAAFGHAAAAMSDDEALTAVSAGVLAGLFWPFYWSVVFFRWWRR